MEFSERIKSLRKEKGFTQKEMARELGITSRTLQNYEAGLSFPRRKNTAQKIADYFNLPLAYLMYDEAQNKEIENEKSPKKYSAQGELNLVLLELNELFNCDKLSSVEKDHFMRSLSEIYWSSKESTNS